MCAWVLPAMLLATLSTRDRLLLVREVGRCTGSWARARLSSSRDPKDARLTCVEISAAYNSVLAMSAQSTSAVYTSTGSRWALPIASGSHVRLV